MRPLLGALTLFVAIQSSCTDRPVVAVCPGKGGISITKIRITHVDKIDLLIVVDNSISMADKQSELGRRIPELIATLTDPTPDPKTGRAQNVKDLHVGVITSSLGSHGTSACAVELTNRANNDRAHLLPRSGEGSGSGFKVKPTAPYGDPVASPCPAPVTSSALGWTYTATTPPAAFIGTPGADGMMTATSCVVQSAKENGCGYEETWEAMYHFLIDPAPYAKAEVKCTFGISGDACGNNKIVVEGLDAEILAQRRAFLRQDSLLGVIILSDENDFSLKPAGLNWLPWGYGKGQMQRGWAACANVPDDFEPETAAEFKKLHDEYKCFSCFEDASDPNCSVKWAADPLNNDVDGRNERGWNQVQRFGYNFLWGRQRYVDAFTKTQVFGSDNRLAANPIYQGGFRTQDLIVVATIVGVPASLVTEPGGRAKPLTSDDWDKIVGPIGKRDAHMIESIKPRDAIPKFAGDRLVDPVAGGDRDIADGDDLQYACIAPRSVSTGGNDCSGPDAAKQSPLCAADGSQPYFKAYPGLRHLRIAKDLGVSGFVASICSDSYRPAIQGISDKLKAALNNQCIRSSLTVDTDGASSCLIVEALKEGEDLGRRCEEITSALCTPGAEPCRRKGTSYPPVGPAEAAAQLNLPISVMQADGSSVPTGTQAAVENGNVYVKGSDGRRHLVCEVRQLTGAELTACINDPSFTMAPSSGGWCYSQNLALLSERCIKIGAPGTVRYLGGAAARSGSETFTFCGVGGGGGC